MIESLISNKQKPNPYNMTCTFIPITNLVPRKRQTKRDTSINNNTTNQIIERERVLGQKINISQRNTIIHLIYIYINARRAALKGVHFSFDVCTVVTLIILIAA